MPQSLVGLPYEIISYVVDGIDIKDVRNLAHTCKKLQYLEREENICRKILEKAKVPFSKEVEVANSAGGGYATSFRQINKRHESVATADPYAVAVVGFCDTYLYCHGVLCYTLDSILRIIDLHSSHNYETVVDLRGLLRNVFEDTPENILGKFRILYYNEGIISCRYKSSAADSTAYLIAFDVLSSRILLTEQLDSTEKLFVRHNSDVLYVGIHSGGYNHHKQWVLRGFQLQQRRWFPQRINLPDLIGSDVGVTVCFEIIGEYFYALSNQTTYEVEEVDWTSFYHCMRFPLGSPSKHLIEKSAEDKHMWRRQHREGPIDDRWASLSLHRDEASGDVNIVETRREFKSGATSSQRTCYTTKVVFPAMNSPENDGTHSLMYSTSDLPSTASSSFGTFTDSSSSVISSASSLPNTSMLGRFEKHDWVAVTNDRLALTLTANDNPHYLAPQLRLPRNIHLSHDGPFVLAQTPLRYYNASSSTFLDLVDDRSSEKPNSQRLRIRVGSRQVKPPAVNSLGILKPEKIDPLTGEVLPGHNEEYTPTNVAFWPPDAASDRSSNDAQEELYNLLNPPYHEGNVEGTADSRSIVYVTGGRRRDQPRAMIFVSFDPAIKLTGLRQWQDAINPPPSHSKCNTTCGQSVGCAGKPVSRTSQGHTAAIVSMPTSAGIGKQKEKELNLEHQPQKQPTGSGGLSKKIGVDHGTTSSWLKREDAMYRVIDKGYNFGWIGSA